MLARRYSQWIAGALMFATVGCGYSQEEWDAKVRENDSLRDQLTTERQAHKKCEADNSAANQQIVAGKHGAKFSARLADQAVQSFADALVWL